MIAPTPEQMRTLANDAHESILAMVAQIENEWGSGTGIDALRLKGDEDVLLADAVSTALRTAADQLEAGSFDAGYRNGYKVGYMHGSRQGRER